MAKRNGSESANLALEIAEKMKGILQEHIRSNEETTKAEHFLQSTLRTAKDRQDPKMSEMRREISTLTRALTTLSHKMVDRSSKRGGNDGYESDGAYATDKSERENLRPNTRSRPNRRKSDDVDQKKTYAKK